MSRRRVLAYLAALSVLFSQGYCSISASESALHTTPELTSEDYELTSFSGIFGMSEEEKAKTIDSFGRVRLLKIKINRETVIIPSVYYKMKVIRDEDKNNSENSSAIRRGLGIALGDLQQLDFVPADYVPESEHIKMYSDLISGEAIVIEEDTDTSRKMLNRNYFKEKFAQNPDYEVSIKDSSLELAMGYYQKQTLENNNFGFNEDIYENPQTLERIFELYKQIVPIQYWPVVLKKDQNIGQLQNVNDTLPELPEQALNQGLENVLLVLIQNKSEFKYVIATKYDENGVKDLRDYFTKESIGLPEPNEEYLRNIGLVNSAEDPFSSLSALLNSNVPANIILNEALKEPDLGRHFKDLRTVGDLIDAYQVLPLEHQADYSHFDFSSKLDMAP